MGVQCSSTVTSTSMAPGAWTATNPTRLRPLVCTCPHGRTQSWSPLHLPQASVECQSALEALPQLQRGCVNLARNLADFSIKHCESLPHFNRRPSPLLTCPNPFPHLQILATPMSCQTKPEWEQIKTRLSQFHLLDDRFGSLKGISVDHLLCTNVVNDPSMRAPVSRDEHL